MPFRNTFQELRTIEWFLMLDGEELVSYVVGEEFQLFWCFLVVV